MAGKFEIKKAKNGQFHFNLKASNGNIILSSEMYTTKTSAKKGIESVRKNAAAEGQFSQLVSKSKKPYFVLKAKNHQIIGQSEMYETEKARDNGIKSVMKHAPDAKLDDLTA